MIRKEIEDILKNYSWMINSIKELRKSLQSAGEGITTQYGVEATLPKPQGVTGDPIYRELIRREKRHAVINKYKAKISVIQDRLHLIKDDRELEVLHWLLEGKSYRWIALHMGLSHSHIRRIRENIVDKLCDTDVPNVPKDTKLIKHQSAC
ncbi:LuxR C-terminal-related transcriptional regulator [Heyndrickxia oleronia]|uniref:helix-turn-helix transcriptional regulator n=1 Tax=Heyndrickxia oleronia TaxID=38875 RepID=UPI00203CB695|nr:LuxR C-terminal-related transcriptional regulator [Heyndrickxia oleronia]MCM3239065.1 LuxR C-terminal-related transcriptional regulator [Heyndrickxia oleronia]